MGILNLTVQVGNPGGTVFEDLEVTVDTGSSYTTVPRTMLERLGVAVGESAPSYLADGRQVPVDVGETVIRLEGRQFHTPVIFAGVDEPALLGVVTLEQARLAVDPLGQKLVPSPLLRY